MAARLARRRTAGAGLLVASAALVLYLASLVPVANLLMGPLERTYPLPAHPAGDVILLLGGGLVQGVPDLSGTSFPAADMLARIVTAARLQKKLGLPVIVSGGAVFEFTAAEAPVDRRLLLDLGVPADRIILEEQSRDTMENARYSARICAQRGFRHPILVTSAYHLRRSVMACVRSGLPVTPVPAGYQVPRLAGYSWAHFLPSSEALHRSATALRELIGILFYTLTG